VSRLLAAIDLGTNTVRLLVADADPATGLRRRLADQVVARLGEGIAERGTLAPAAVERALTAVRGFRERARALGAAEVLLVATAAVRQARDGHQFLETLRAEPGLSSRMVSGDEEASLTLLGATWGLGETAETFALLDIGGGSTEIAIAAGGEPRVTTSLALGVVPLVERFFADERTGPAQLAACRTHVDARLRAEAWPRIRPHRPSTLVATAGTPTTLAALDLGLDAYDPARVQGHRLTLVAVDRLTARLAALPLAERGRLPVLEPGRADVIVPGAIVLAAALSGLDLPAAVVSDAGLREGVLLDAVGWRPVSAARRTRPDERALP
jgi:exopolyphosphatase/guanosine-5'-triphosphate,3'-diphosphate pyrophosphatase